MKGRKVTLPSIVTSILRSSAFLALLGVALLLTVGLIKWAKYTKQSQSLENPPLARVYNQYLYKSDLEHLDAVAGSDENRAEKIEKYIQSWISKQLLIAEAEAHSKYKKAEIERRVFDYRNDLLVHSFMDKLVNTQVDREVSKDDIVSYYQAHQKDFLLRSNIFRGKFVVLPKATSNRTQLRSLLMGNTEEKLAKLKRYCLQFAHNYVLDETVWLPWDELITGTSLDKTRNMARRLRTEKFLQASNADQIYYFKITEYKLAGDVAPVEFISDQIIDIIIYKRKLELASKFKKDILQRAQKNNNCVIYEH